MTNAPPPPKWIYPPELLAERQRVAAEGGFRARVQFDLEPRPAYAFGLLAAADVARFCGVGAITAIEFGVATGDGLLRLCSLAEQVTAETGVEIEIWGVDNATGLPAPRDHRDHPEVWSAGDFRMPDPEALRARLPSNARLLLGDIAALMPQLRERLDRGRPLGFCAFDVDLYSSTVDALGIYGGDPETCLPAGIAFFDDVIGGPGRIASLFRNRRGGQLRAIEEFNAASEAWLLDKIRTLRYRRPLNRQPWLEQVYAIHSLAHPFRAESLRAEPFAMGDYAKDPRYLWPF